MSESIQRDERNWRERAAERDASVSPRALIIGGTREEERVDSEKRRRGEEAETMRSCRGDMRALHRGATNGGATIAHSQHLRHERVGAATSTEQQRTWSGVACGCDTCALSCYETRCSDDGKEARWPEGVEGKASR